MKISTLLPILLTVAGFSSESSARGSGIPLVTNERLHRCAVISATVILVEEALLTRTAVTAANAAAYATPVTLVPGDRRLTKLGTLLGRLALTPGRSTWFEPRTFLRLRCVDGTLLAVEASATQGGGIVYVKVGARVATTHAPFRRKLEGLLGFRPPFSHHQAF